MSEHEGFCIPLLEAMHFGVPICAYRAAAVPDTLGGSGVLFYEKDYAKLAELIDLMLTDEAVRKRIVAGQNERLKRFDPAALATRMREYLAPWL
jgi:glycosyltransferase involved in cell wall biosynthesis